MTTPQVLEKYGCELIVEEYFIEIYDNNNNKHFDSLDFNK